MNTSNIFEIQVRPDATLLRFFGFVDAGTVQQIRPVLQRQIPEHCLNLVVDLKDVGFLDSHGVGLFVSFLKQLHRNKGRIIFAGANGQPASVLQMVGLNGALVTYCPTVKEALNICEKDKRA